MATRTNGIIPSRLSWLLFLSMTLSVPASGQAPVTPRGQEVMLADLEGIAAVQTIIHQMVQRRGDRVYQVKGKDELELVVGSGKVDWSAAYTAYTQWGVRQGKTATGSLIIEQVGKRPEGYGVWVFKEGTLTFLVTIGTAAIKREFTFTRTAQGLTCTAKRSFFRENGRGPIIFKSAVDGANITIISDKLVSSTCRVTRQPQFLSKQ